MNHKHIDTTTVRSHLLAAVVVFVDSARKLSGVNRIALLGSLTTPKPNPKDADLLVVVDDEIVLTSLAKLGRQLKGTTQQINCGADIFLANPRSEYIGRICSWRDCRPGIRQSCYALHCGSRPHLYDDLDIFCLNSNLIAEPPIDLWPQVIERAALPLDARKFLLSS